MDNNVNNFSDFGLSFQERLLSLIITDRTFSDQIKEVLDIYYFESKPLQVLCKQVFDFKDKYKTHPDNKTILSLINTELSKETATTKEQVAEFFTRLQKEERIENEEYVKEQSLQFCKKQVLKKAMIESIDLLQKASFDEIATTINDALKKGLDNNLGYDYIKDFDDRFQIKSRNPVSTGLKELDGLMKGGPGKGDLVIVIAPSGAGKSMLLTFFGTQALLQNKNVVHYTLELSDKNVANRYDSCITTIDLNDLVHYKEQIYEKIKDIKGSLIVKEYPTKSVTVNSIKNHLERIRQRGKTIDLVVVDYLDLLRSGTSYKEKRYELEGITEELRALAQKFEVPVYTCTQSNRSAVEEEVISAKGISEAYSKIFPADVVMSLSRTREDKMANTARLHIIKNRLGGDAGIYPLYFNTSNVSIKILQEPVELKTEEQKQAEEEKKFKEKYKIYRQQEKSSN